MSTLIINSPKQSMIQFDHKGSNNKYKVYDIIHKIPDVSKCTTQNKYKNTHSYQTHNFCEIDDIIAVILGDKLDIPIYSRDKNLHRFKWIMDKNNIKDPGTHKLRVKKLKNFEMLPNIPISFIESSKHLKNKNEGIIYQPEKRYFPIYDCINILKKYQKSEYGDMRIQNETNIVDAFKEADSKM